MSGEKGNQKSLFGGDPSLKTIRPSGFLARFFLTFIVSVVLLGSLLFGYYHFRSGLDKRMAALQDRTAVQAAEKLIIQQLSEIIIDIQFFQRCENLKAFLDSASPANFRALSEDFLTLAEIKGFYDQIRFLDPKGVEIIRVDYKRGFGVIAPAGELQDKRDRYYFQEAIKLGPGEIYMSRFDLNLEHGQVEIPFKPVIRFASAIYDDQGRKRGILVFNFLAGKMLDRIGAFTHGNPGRMMLVDCDGFYFRGPTSAHEWGAALIERRNRNLANDYPEFWNQSRKKLEGQTLTPAGLFSFTNVNPLRAGLELETGPQRIHHPPNNPQPQWMIISMISREALDELSRDSLILTLLLYTILTAMSAIVSFILAHITYQRVLEKAQLEQARLEWELTFDTSPDMIIVMDADRRVTRVNRAWAERHGQPKEFFLGKECYEVFMGEIHPACRIHDSDPSAETFIAEDQNLESHFLITSAPLLDHQGRVLGGICISRDVSAMKEIEDELRRHKKELETLYQGRTIELEQANRDLTDEISTRKKTEASLNLEAEQNQVLAVLSKKTTGSPALKEVLDLVLHQSVRMTGSEWGWVGSISETTGRPDFSMALRRASVDQGGGEDGLPLQIEVNIFKWILENRASLVVNDPNSELWEEADIPAYIAVPAVSRERVVGLIFLSGAPYYSRENLSLIERQADILALFLERRLIETNLQESEERFRDIVESMSDWIWEVDAEARFTYCSEKVFVVLGYRPEEMTGRRIFDFMDQDSAERMVDIFRELSGRKEPCQDLESVHIHRDGRRVVMLTNGVPILNPEGNLIGYRGVNRDITERLRAEEEMRAAAVARQAAEKANRMKDEFMSFMSHELRTPLGGIIGFAQTMQRAAARGLLTPERQESHLASIVSSSRHLAGIIEDVLDVAMIEAEKMEINLEPVNLNQILDRVYSNIYPQAIEKGLEIELEVKDDLPPVRADGKRLTQVFYNLVGNAVKFTSKGSIKVEAHLSEEDPDYVLTLIKDTGPGISPENLSTIFDRFTRLESSGVIPGAGLGLTISRKLVEMQGGKLWVTSEPGQGSIFYFTLKIWDGLV